MAFEFKLPDLGEGVAEGEVVKWLVAEGDTVEEDQPLAEVIVGNPDDSHFSDRWVLQQAGLDLPGANPVPTGLDQIGASPSQDPNGTRFRPRREVTGIEPAVVVQDRGGRIVAVEIPGKDGGTPDRDFPDRLIVIRIELVALIIDQLQLDAGERRPDVAWHRSVRRRYPAIDEGLGQSVALVNAPSGESLDVLVLA